MDFFGLPLYITYEQYKIWLDTYFSFLEISNDTFFIGYLIVIFIQLHFLIFALEMFIKFIISIMNIIKRKRYRGF